MFSFGKSKSKEQNVIFGPNQNTKVTLDHPPTTEGGSRDTRNKLNCHNPTNNPKQLKTTFVGVVLLSVKKTTTNTTATTPGLITILAVPGNL